MKMDKIAGSGNDEFYTPKYAVKAIMPYILEKGYKTVWCPFDTVESNFVKLLSAAGMQVLYSHIKDGCDFFNMPVPECDCIISNPPYSRKGDVFARLFGIGKPFAMLVGVVGLFEGQKRFDMFRNNEFEVLYLNKRVSYLQSYTDIKPALNPPFSSVYVCRGLLPKQISFAYIDKNDI